MSAPTIPARPTLYKGIRMRSRLEADYAAHLDETGEAWEYEPECFASDQGQWLPDFRVGSYRILTEVKPAGALPAEHGAGGSAYEKYVDAHLERMTVAWASDPDACLQLVYWRYGGPAELIVYSVGRRHPWFACTTTDASRPALLWTGMGQMEMLYRAGHGS